jgi:hypothetical protein
MKVAQQMSLFLAGFLFFGSATIGFKWVTSPYLWGYVAAGLGFLALSFFLGTLEWRVKKARVRRIRFHDLRHTHATMGLRAGVPVKVMSERLGHSTPVFTLQQYAHVVVCA